MMSFKNTSKLKYNALIQALLLSLLWISCNWVSITLSLPITGGILGFALVLTLLLTKSIRVEYVKNGAQLLLRDMLLFFIPAVLAILEHQEFLGVLGIKVLGVIILSTIAVMVVTAFVVDCCFHLKAPSC